MNAHRHRRPRCKPHAVPMLLLGAPLALWLGGCATQAQSFGDAADVQSAWARQLNQLPVVAEGAPPRSYQLQLAKKLPSCMAGGINLIDGSYRKVASTLVNPTPNATPQLSFAQQAEKRVVLLFNVANAPNPVNTCALYPQQLIPGNPSGDVDLHAALCDGTRTVSYLHTKLPQQAFSPEHAPAQIASLKQQLLKALPNPANTVYDEPDASKTQCGPTTAYPGG